MQELFSRHFFSTDEFEHKELFDMEAPAWEALRVLTPYLERSRLGKIEADIPSTAYLIDRSLISIAPGCVIEPGAYIQGPVILGPRTIVRHGAYVRGFVVTGEDCVIGHATEVKHSIFLNRACAAHFNYVGDSILGNDVNIGAGVKLANFRFDHAPITLLHQGQKIITNLKKFGAIIGDGAQLGCNAVTNPGTIIGRRSFCYPCVDIRGVLPTRTIYRDR